MLWAVWACPLGGWGLWVLLGNAGGWSQSWRGLGAHLAPEMAPSMGSLGQCEPDDLEAQPTEGWSGLKTSLSSQPPPGRAGTPTGLSSPVVPRQGPWRAMESHMDRPRSPSSASLQVPRKLCLGGHEPPSPTTGPLFWAMLDHIPGGPGPWPPRAPLAGFGYLGPTLTLKPWP